MPLDWDSVPSSVRAVVEALRFSESPSERLRDVSEKEWPALLDWCDRRQVTLLLHELCGAQLPDAVRGRIALSRERYALRFVRIESELMEIADAMRNRGIEFVVLKGITHAPALTPHPLLRAQGDIDLWFEASSIHDARTVLLELGYQPRRGTQTRDDRRHLAPMARPSSWKWRGDIFDPEMPIHVEAHFQLWSDDAEHVPIPGQMDFWTRRTARDFSGGSLPVLCGPDLLGFAALHFLLHLLHGDLPLQRAWEIAFFLHANARNEEFWERHRQLHSPALRRMETVAFAIAQAWFHCDLYDGVRRGIHALADDVRLWLDHFALSPLKQRSNPNKHELWLHMALIPTMTGRASVLFRRLFPFVVGRKGGMSASRLVHHCRTFKPTLTGGLHWLHLKRPVQRAAPRPAPSP